MLADGQELITTNAWLSLAPAVLIVLTAASMTLIGDWVYDAPLEGARAGMSEPQLSDVGTDTRLGPTLSVRRLMGDHGSAATVSASSSAKSSFDLSAGETMAIVGESGSGKSMTARSIVGLLPSGVSAHGSVSLAGEPLLTPARGRCVRSAGARIALLLQDPFAVLNPVQTVREHILESLPTEVRRNRANAREQVRDRLQEVGLSSDRVGTSYPFQLSGGMRQRVAVAAALARDPELLIADEPTTALDVSAQADVLGLLGSLQRRRAMALLLITHDLRVALSVSDRVLVMYAGTILEHGPASALMRGPRHPYTLGLLLAEPPVSHFVEHLTSAPGDAPSHRQPLVGCAFAQRCRWRASECATVRPSLRLVGEGRESACLRIDRIAREMQAELSAPRGGSPPVAPGNARCDLSLRGRLEALPHAGAVWTGT